MRKLAKFSTQMTSAVVGGLLMFVVLFFAGLLIEGALNIMGALAVYGIPQWTIPAILGAFGFLQALLFELSRRLDITE